MVGQQRDQRDRRDRLAPLGARRLSRRTTLRRLGDAGLAVALLAGLGRAPAPASAGPATPPASPGPAGAEPDLFELAGGGAEITYATSSFAGPPQLTYRLRSTETRTFAGGEIRAQESELGTLVSVSLAKSVDAGATVLTLVLPGVNLAGATAQPVAALAVVTRSFGLLPRAGARRTYQVLALQGTARLVAF